MSIQTNMHTADRKRFVYLEPSSGELSVWADTDDSLRLVFSFRKDCDDQQSERIRGTTTAKQAMQFMNFECLGEL